MSLGHDRGGLPRQASEALTYAPARRPGGTMTRWRGWLGWLLARYREACLRPLVSRSFYPSALAVRLGQAAGIDGLFLEILASQYRLETGRGLPPDLSLPELAAVRADLLPRALARREVRLLVEQHVVARLHVLLGQKNFDVETWIRAHHRDPRLAAFRATILRLGRLPHGEVDPVPVLRVNPDVFSEFVWKRFWALAELEHVLLTAVPATQPPVLERATEGDPASAAVKVAMRLDTDHDGWAHPEQLLRALHAEMRAASSLDPEHPLVRHVLQRVQRAVQRLLDFDEAYERGTAQDPLPEWVSTALEEVESSDVLARGTESATKLVRRIACRLWVTGAYALPPTPAPPAVAKPEAPPSLTVVAPPPPPPVARAVRPVATPPGPDPIDEDIETGF